MNHGLSEITVSEKLLLHQLGIFNRVCVCVCGVGDFIVSHVA